MLSLTVQFASDAKALPSRAQVRRWVSATRVLAAEALRLNALECSLTLRYVDEEEARELNRHFRQKDYATNVLTFVSDEHAAHPSLRAKSPKQKRNVKRCSADIAICAPVVAREAKAQKKTPAAHHAHMVVHAVLHSIGFDHDQEAEAQQMEALEARVLRRFRINNPYL